MKSNPRNLFFLFILLGLMWFPPSCTQIDDILEGGFIRVDKTIPQIVSTSYIIIKLPYTDDSETFSWSEVTGCSYYEMEIAEEETFETLLIQKQVEINQYALSSNDFLGEQSLQAGTYYYRVRTNISDWSSVQSFDVLDENILYVDDDCQGEYCVGSPTHPINTITKGLNTAFELGMGEIYVGEGEYQESISINKDIILRGGFNDQTWERYPNPIAEGNRSTIIGYKSTAISLNFLSSESIIEGFAIIGNPTPEIPIGIAVLASLTEGQIINNYILGEQSEGTVYNSIGIFSQYSGISIENNSITGGQDSDICIGAYVIESYGINLNNNTIAGGEECINGNGIILHNGESGGYFGITNNAITSPSYTSDTILANNEKSGIYIVNTQEVLITGNAIVVKPNSQGEAIGIQMMNSSGELQNNSIDLETDSLITKGLVLLDNEEISVMNLDINQNAEYQTTQSNQETIGVYIKGAVSYDPDTPSITMDNLNIFSGHSLEAGSLGIQLYEEVHVQISNSNIESGDSFADEGKSVSIAGEDGVDLDLSACSLSTGDTTGSLTQCSGLAFRGDCEIVINQCTIRTGDCYSNQGQAACLAIDQNVQAAVINSILLAGDVIGVDSGSFNASAACLINNDSHMVGMHSIFCPGSISGTAVDKYSLGIILPPTSTGTFSLYNSIISLHRVQSGSTNACISNKSTYSGDNPIAYQQNILWNAGLGIDIDTGPDAKCTNCAVNSISADPLWIAGDPYDYHLQSELSPAVDEGYYDGAIDPPLPTVDMENNARPEDIGGVGDGVQDYDIGPYEYQP